MKALLLLFILSASVCLADPSPSPVAVSSPTGAIGIWDWIMAHQVIVGGFLAAVLDFVFALNPNAASNGVLHWIYLLVRKLAGLPPPATTP